MDMTYVHVKFRVGTIDRIPQYQHETGVWEKLVYLPRGPVVHDVRGRGLSGEPSRGIRGCSERKSTCVLTKLGARRQAIRLRPVAVKEMHLLRYRGSELGVEREIRIQRGRA